MTKQDNADVINKFGEHTIHIQVTTDANIQGHEDLIQRVTAEARYVLSRFAKQIMSLEIHFTDEDGSKHGNVDKRCLMEVRCSGRTPVAVSNESSTIEGAFRGAMKKLQNLLTSILGKADGHKGVKSIRTESHAEPQAMIIEHLS